MLVLVHGESVNLLILVIYRPGSSAIKWISFDEFVAVVGRFDHRFRRCEQSRERSAGIVDIHLLWQRIWFSTHRPHPTCRTYTGCCNNIQKATFVSATVSRLGRIIHWQQPTYLLFMRYSHVQVVIKRPWKEFDVDAFCKDLSESNLLTNPPTDCQEYFISYYIMTSTWQTCAPGLLFNVLAIHHHGLTLYGEEQRSGQSVWRRTAEKLVQSRCFGNGRCSLTFSVTFFMCPTRTAGSCPDSKTLWRNMYECVVGTGRCLDSIFKWQSWSYPCGNCWSSTGDDPTKVSSTTG